MAMKLAPPESGCFQCQGKESACIEFSHWDRIEAGDRIMKVYICFACLGDAREMITRQLMKEYRKVNR